MLSRFASYLRYELNRAPLTVEAYLRDISQFSDWLGSHNQMQENIDFSLVTAGDVRSWLASLSRNAESPRTVRRKAQSLRALFRWMLKEKIISSSPMRDIPLPKLSKPLPDFIKPQEIEDAIASEMPQDNDNPIQIRDNLIVEVLYALGIRRAELVAIDDADVSFTKAEIKVTGKRSKQRVVPVPLVLLNKIKHWQTLRNRFLEAPSSETPLFIHKGQRIKTHKVYEIVKKALEGTSARKKSPHALRHSFASAMLNSGADLDSVREFLGHASLATTQIYTHISLKEIKKIYSDSHPRSDLSKK